MTDLAVGRIFHSNWLDLLELHDLFGRNCQANIEFILIEIKISILAGFADCLIGSIEAATQNGPENLANSIWLWSQFGGSTKLGKTKGGIRNPPFENPPQFLRQCCDRHSAPTMLSDRLNPRLFELGILQSLCQADWRKIEL